MMQDECERLVDGKGGVSGRGQWVIFCFAWKTVDKRGFCFRWRTPGGENRGHTRWCCFQSLDIQRGEEMRRRRILGGRGYRRYLRKPEKVIGERVVWKWWWCFKTGWLREVGAHKTTTFYRNALWNLMNHSNHFQSSI